VTPRFVLCIGCQKGGTTWLAEYLRGSADVRLGLRKEMHVLDAHFLETNRDWHERRLARIDARLARAGSARGPVREAMARRAEGHRRAQRLAGDLEDYARYFRELADAPGVAAVADLTPDYALLTAEHWTRTREVLERHGFAPRLLFLMRDPVGRLESVWRMRARDQAIKAVAHRALPARALSRGAALWRHVVAKLAPNLFASGFRAFATQPLNLERSRYERTIAAVEAAFPPEAIHYEFFETLFRPEAMARIAAFAGIADRPANLAERQNASPLQTPIAARERAELRALLEPTYAYCAARFGEVRLRALWKSFPTAAPGAGAPPSPGRDQLSARGVARAVSATPRAKARTTAW
jgi:hypothetical protein